MRRIALAIFGLWFWTGAAHAGDNVIARDSVIFNVMPTTPGYFNLGDGQYVFKYHAVIQEKGEYFADQQFFSNADWERGQRLRIVFDQAGRASFEPKIKFVSKSDDGALSSLDRLSERWLRYAAWIKQGRSMDPPGGLDDYKKDGMLVKNRRGGCDPFGNSARISFARIGDDLSRTDELNYDRSLIVLSETPLASRSVQSTLDECPALVNDYAEHVLKANAFDFSLFKVKESYVLAPTGLPLTILLRDPVDDFCGIIRYRNGIGEWRDLTFIYASTPIVTGLLKVREEQPDRLTNYPAYLAANLEDYRMLSAWAGRLDCQVVIRRQNP